MAISILRMMLAVPLGISAGFGLLLLMQQLIATGNRTLDQSETPRIAEFVRVVKDETPKRKVRRSRNARHEDHRYPGQSGQAGGTAIARRMPERPSGPPRAPSFPTRRIHAAGGADFGFAADTGCETMDNADSTDTESAVFSASSRKRQCGAGRADAPTRSSFRGPPLTSMTIGPSRPPPLTSNREE